MHENAAMNLNLHLLQDACSCTMLKRIAACRQGTGGYRRGMEGREDAREALRSGKIRSGKEAHLHFHGDVLASTAEQNGSQGGNHIEKSIWEREAIEIVLARMAIILVVAIVQGTAHCNPAVANGAKCSQCNQAAVGMKVGSLHARQSIRCCDIALMSFGETSAGTVTIPGFCTYYVLSISCS